MKWIRKYQFDARKRTFNRTERNWNKNQKVSDVLHVPFNRTERNWNVELTRGLVSSDLAFNRTERNWNQDKIIEHKLSKRLLIVPKGIEIIILLTLLLNCSLLLIVPKGIEISIQKKPHHLTYLLLIVPKGIEIAVNLANWFQKISFNRTERNWNCAFFLVSAATRCRF